MADVNWEVAVPSDRILVVEDDPQVRFLLCAYLEDHGFAVQGVSTVAQAEGEWRLKRPSLAILDYDLPDGNAIQLLLKLRPVDTSTPVYILTGRGTIEIAVEAIKLGAEHFITKPADLPALLVLINKSLTQRRAQQAGMRRASTGLDPFAGTNDKVRCLEELAFKTA